jgi:hypothetical protein
MVNVVLYNAYNAVYCETLSLHIFGSLCNFLASAGRASTR